MTEAEILEAAKEFLTEKLSIKDIKPGLQWYPRVDVQLAWLQDFAASVTQSQAAEIQQVLESVKMRQHNVADPDHYWKRFQSSEFEKGVQYAVERIRTKLALSNDAG